VNGCNSGPVITLVKGGDTVTAEILGEGSTPWLPEACDINLTRGDDSGQLPSMQILADSVEACTHNAYIFFYKTMTEDCVIYPCAGGYDGGNYF
jgi:hypothetical protein